ncbi:hypothetical protein BV22DRAFT_1128675 [Leucogyrophana mollusca]|uniref:Uncharacterized protein n=1 Tax=Leucogyrophana mollusca TaxID=85980 RepID=A0ACB8BKY8_9AGAM|nr:hypothetical protein BV22DRAFT_1128675 [Leucogyrophana mollusca]
MATLNGTAHPIFDVAAVVGPVNITTVVTALLFGCSIIQTYIYYGAFAKDRHIIKIMVVAVMILELAHLACAVDSMWYLSITVYVNPQKLAVWPVSGILMVPITVVIRFLVQFYFTFRLWKLSDATLLSISCTILSLVAAATGFAVAGTAFGMTDLNDYCATQRPLITLFLVSQAVADATITLALVYHLRQKRVMAFSRTATSIDKLILWTAETGFVSSTLAILIVIFFLTLEQTYVWNALYVCFGSVYANSFLAMLNGRLIIRAIMSEGAYELETKVHTSPEGRNSAGTRLLFVTDIYRTAGHQINQGKDSNETQVAAGSTPRQ